MFKGPFHAILAAACLLPPALLGALPEAGFTYTIQAKHSGKVVDIIGGPAALADQIEVQQFTALGPNQTNQRFRLIDEGNNTFSIRPQSTGKCLDVRGGLAATANGIKLQQYTCNGQNNQKFQLEELGGADAGYFKITAVHSGKVLDVTGGPGATQNGAKLQQFDWLNGDNQKFSFLLKARNIICVAARDTTTQAQNRFVTKGEGYELVGLSTKDYTQAGGNISDCLTNVADGDNLVIVGHGRPGSFTWNADANTRYTGFGAGAGQGASPAPVPAAFANLNRVNAKLYNCFSGTPDPAGGTSMVDRLRAALGGAGRNHIVSGFNRATRSGSVSTLTGGTAAQRAAARTALTNDRSWETEPPVNRPGAATNHRAAAQAIIAATPGTGPVVFVLPNARGRDADNLYGYTGDTPDTVVTNDNPVSAVDSDDDTCGDDTETLLDAPEDVSSQVVVTRGGFRYDRSTGYFVQVVTFRNVSSSAIAGPVSLALDSLSDNATLVNPAGTTAATTPSNSPYIDIDIGSANMLNPGQNATVTLQFMNPSQTGITYQTHLLAGSGVR